MGISRPNQQQLPSEGVISSILNSYSGNPVIESVVYDVSLSDLEKLIKAAGMTYDAKTPKVTLVKNLINYLWQQLPAKDGEALGEELFHLIKTNLSSLEDSTVLQLIYSLLRVYLQPEIDSKPAEPPVESKISPPKYSDEQIRIFSNIIEKIHEVRSLIENVNTIIKLCAEKDPKVYGPIEANDAVGLRKLLTLDESVPPFRGSVARVASQEIASDRLSLAEDADYFNIVRKDIELRIALLKQLLDLNLEKIIIIPGNQLGIEGLDIAGIKKTIKLLEDRLGLVVIDSLKADLPWDYDSTKVSIEEKILELLEKDISGSASASVKLEDRIQPETKKILFKHVLAVRGALKPRIEQYIKGYSIFSTDTAKRPTEKANLQKILSENPLDVDAMAAIVRANNPSSHEIFTNLVIGSDKDYEKTFAKLTFYKDWVDSDGIGDEFTHKDELGETLVFIAEVRDRFREQTQGFAPGFRLLEKYSDATTQDYSSIKTFQAEVGSKLGCPPGEESEYIRVRSIAFVQTVIAQVSGFPDEGKVNWARLEMRVAESLKIDRTEVKLYIAYILRVIYLNEGPVLLSQEPLLAMLSIHGPSRRISQTSAFEGIEFSEGNNPKGILNKLNPVRGFRRANEGLQNRGIRRGFENETFEINDITDHFVELQESKDASIFEWLRIDDVDVLVGDGSFDLTKRLKELRGLLAHLEKLISQKRLLKDISIKDIFEWEISIQKALQKELVDAWVRGLRQVRLADPAIVTEVEKALHDESLFDVSLKPGQKGHLKSLFEQAILPLYDVSISLDFIKLLAESTALPIGALETLQEDIKVLEKLDTNYEDPFIFNAEQVRKRYKKLEVVAGRIPINRRLYKQLRDELAKEVKTIIPPQELDENIEVLRMVRWHSAFYKEMLRGFKREAVVRKAAAIEDAYKEINDLFEFVGPGAMEMRLEHLDVLATHTERQQVKAFKKGYDRMNAIIPKKGLGAGQEEETRTLIELERFDPDGDVGKRGAALIFLIELGNYENDRERSNFLREVFGGGSESMWPNYMWVVRNIVDSSAPVAESHLELLKIANITTATVGPALQFSADVNLDDIEIDDKPLKLNFEMEFEELIRLLGEAEIDSAFPSIPPVPPTPRSSPVTPPATPSAPGAVPLPDTLGDLEPFPQINDTSTPAEVREAFEISQRNADKLRGKLDSGEIDGARYESVCREQIIEYRGTSWFFNTSSGKWNKFIDSGWVEGTPDVLVPPAEPFVPPTPGATPPSPGPDLAPTSVEPAGGSSETFSDDNAAYVVEVLKDAGIELDKDAVMKLYRSGRITVIPDTDPDMPPAKFEIDLSEVKPEFHFGGFRGLADKVDVWNIARGFDVYVDNSAEALDSTKMQWHSYEFPKPQYIQVGSLGLCLQYEPATAMTLTPITVRGVEYIYPSNDKAIIQGQVSINVDFPVGLEGLEKRFYPASLSPEGKIQLDLPYSRKATYNGFEYSSINIEEGTIVLVNDTGEEDQVYPTETTGGAFEVAEDKLTPEQVGLVNETQQPLDALRAKLLKVEALLKVGSGAYWHLWGSPTATAELSEMGTRKSELPATYETLIDKYNGEEKAKVKLNVEGFGGEKEPLDHSNVVILDITPEQAESINLPKDPRVSIACVKIIQPNNKFHEPRGGVQDYIYLALPTDQVDELEKLLMQKDGDTYAVFDEFLRQQIGEENFTTVDENDKSKLLYEETKDLEVIRIGSADDKPLRFFLKSKRYLGTINDYFVELAINSVNEKEPGLWAADNWNSISALQEKDLVFGSALWWHFGQSLLFEIADGVKHYLNSDQLRKIAGLVVNSSEGHELAEDQRVYLETANRILGKSVEREAGGGKLDILYFADYRTIFTSAESYLKDNPSRAGILNLDWFLDDENLPLWEDLFPTPGTKFWWAMIIAAQEAVRWRGNNMERVSLLLQRAALSCLDNDLKLGKDTPMWVRVEYGSLDRVLGLQRIIKSASEETLKSIISQKSRSVADRYSSLMYSNINLQEVGNSSWFENAKLFRQLAVRYPTSLLALKHALAILGLTYEGTVDKLKAKKEYIKLSKQYHTDVPGSGNEEIFKEVNEAHSFIKDWGK